ncbi:MAG: chromate transporter [Ruminococcaceae bacterium]|nr:chromate transporter [Oscillospiraceae bacterium]
MILLSLFWEFLKIGLFTFGGAYGAIPLIRQSALSHGWMTEEMFSNILAVSESTPGPIMVNSATYIGASQAGILGAAVATLGVVLPSFVVIILISVLFTKLVKHPSVQAVLKGVKPCVMGVILATGIYMALEALAGLPVAFSPDIASILLFFLLLSALILYPRLRKKPLSPILLIVLAAGFGILFY